MAIFWFFLMLFCFLVLRTCIKAYFIYRRLKRGMRQAFGEQQDTRQRSKTKPKPEPQRKPKKIDPSVGEYVRFTEIKVDTTTTTADPSTGQQTTTTVEQQVVDVEWEDIS